LSTLLPYDDKRYCFTRCPPPGPHLESRNAAANRPLFVATPGSRGPRLMATILVVDDRPSNRHLLLSLLGFTAHRLLEAGDGAQARAAARIESLAAAGGAQWPPLSKE
jgi:hypothetical protein